jgi:hypothetical protein
MPVASLHEQGPLIEVRQRRYVVTDVRQSTLPPELLKLHFEHNVASLSARAAQIPGEIEAETAAIRARYAKPRSQLFPVAVTFLVPEKYAR